MNRKGFRDPRSDDLAAYALDALGQEERARVDEFLERSEEARRDLAELLETTAALASAVPPAEPSAGLRQRLIAAAIANDRRAPLQLPPVGPAPLAPVGGAGPAATRSRQLAVRVGFAASFSAVAAAVAVAIFFGIETAQLRSDLRTLNTRLEDERTTVGDVRETVTDLKTELAAASEQADQNEEQVSSLAQANAALHTAIRDQRWVTYVTFERDWEATGWFRAGAGAPQAQGQIVVSPQDDRAALFVDGMPTLPEGYVYQLWLVGSGWRWQGVKFEVNEYGYARVDFDLPAGVAQFNTAAVTREMESGEGAGVEVMSAPSNR